MGRRKKIRSLVFKGTFTIHTRFTLNLKKTTQNFFSGSTHAFKKIIFIRPLKETIVHLYFHFTFSKKKHPPTSSSYLSTHPLSGKKLARQSVVLGFFFADLPFFRNQFSPFFSYWKITYIFIHLSIRHFFKETFILYVLPFILLRTPPTHIFPIFLFLFHFKKFPIK